MAQVVSESRPSQSSASGNASLYSSLPVDTSRKEIRLLKILFTDPQLKFTMHTESLLEAPVFSALSYRWGGPKSTVIVNEINVTVAQNLIDAVRDIYSHLVNNSDDQKPRLLWADAVCINQEDNSDKSQQVPLMKEIYTQAKQVLSWLGPANESVDTAFRYLRLLYDEVQQNTSNNDLQWIQKHQDLCTDPKHLRDMGPWQLISDLMESDYWHRVWIFQELFLGNDTILISGRNSFPFAHMMRVHKDLSPHFRDEKQRKYFGDHTWFYFTRCMSLLTTVLQPILDAQHTVQLFEKHGYNSQNNGTILILLVLFKKAIISLGAKDPRDFIYAFAGVANVSMKPDYNRLVHLVYIDFIEWWRAFLVVAEQQRPLRRSQKTMWFLRFARASNPVPDEKPWPSWLPTPVWGSHEQPLHDRSHSIINAVFCDDDAPSWMINETFLHCTAVKIDSVCNLGITVHGPIREILDSQRLMDEFWAIGDLNSTHQPRMPDFLPQLLRFAFTKEELMQEQARYSRWDFLYQVLFQDSTEDTLQNKEHVLDAISCLVSKVWPGLWEVDVYNGNPFDDFYTGHKTLAECVLGKGFHEWSKSANADVQGLEDFLNMVSRRWDWNTEDQERERVTSRVARSLRVGANGQVTRTTEGYAAILPPKIQKGDEIWLLKDYENPVVLQPAGDSYILIGNCLVPNCLERRSEDSVQKLQREACEIKIG